MELILKNILMLMSMFLKIKNFKPEFYYFLWSDAHKDDPLSNINLKSEDYHEITKGLC